MFCHAKWVQNHFILAAYFPFSRIINCKCIWACRMSSSPVADMFVHLLFLPCGVDMSKNLNIDPFNLGSFSGNSSNLIQFLVSQEEWLLCSVTFMMCGLFAHKTRNFWSKFLYDFGPFFRCLFATRTNSFALLQLRCDFINTSVVIKCWEFVALPWQGEGCWFYPLPQNFSGFSMLFLLPQRVKHFSVLFQLQKRNWQLHLRVWS